MTTATVAAAPTPGRLWTGRILGIVTSLFLAVDSLVKLLELEPAVKGSAQLGFAASATRPIGVLLAACLAVYLVPRTALLGAVLLTGYLGGAVAIHYRAGNGAFPIVFTLGVGVLVWLALALREPGIVRRLGARP
jgi:hypothetical protein